MNALKNTCQQWPTLAEKTPEQGQLCAYCLIEPEYSDSGIGLYANGAFASFKGGFFGDPKKTHWVAVGQHD
jgi:hypothetical protein